MSLCFCPDVKNEDELIQILEHGRWDRKIFEYLIEIMSEKESKKLSYDPVELFEMQARLLDDNELVYLKFWDVRDSGIYDGRKCTMNKKQRELFDLFVVRIREIYHSLLKLVCDKPVEKICVEPIEFD